tara:strand:- start:352 stop:576 length:225 start_codon:yes stop_codon:yes gene_type:complete
MNIDDLKDRIKNLNEAKQMVEDVLYYIEQVEYLCRDVGVQGSHHGEMEYQDVLCRIEEELEDIESKLAELGVTL